jgi:hypothetical protein
MQEFLFPLFFTMFGLAIVWLVLAFTLFARLKSDYPEMHKILGSPRGFEPQATQALFSFLLTRKPESLNDSGLLVQANVMRVLLVIYVVGFALLVYLTMNQAKA